MEMICPECMGALAPVDRRIARCTAHGGEFTVLFNREEQPPAPGAGVVPGDDALSADSGAPPPLTPMQILAQQRPTGRYCVQHPSLPATQQCQACGAYMCDTCDFALPDGRHLCPACATKAPASLGPKRRRSMIWSFVCAAGASMGFAVSIVYAGLHPARSEAEQQAQGVLLMFVALVPAIVGLGFGLGAIDRRHNNPPSLWTATIWNGLVIALFLLLMIVGLMK